MDDRRVSRRGFLSTTGQAMLGVPLLAKAAPALAQVPQFPLPEIPGKKLGWAIVGLGRLAVNQILPGLADAKRSRLAAFVSGSPDKAKRLAQVYGLPEKSIHRYQDMERLASDPAVDVVYVVLPNSMHAEYTIRALKAGKHVLCEKPMANTPKDCEEMIAAAKAANRKLMIGYRLHYEPYNQALVKIARDTAEMGPTRLILAEAGFSIGDPAQWRLRRAMAGGGSLMDIGIYALQAARYLAGTEPTEVDAQVSSTPNDPRFTEVEENVTFQLRFPGALVANCTSSYGVGVNRFRVCKPNAAAELDPALSYNGLRMRVFRNGGIEERQHPAIDQFQTEMDHFSGSIQDGTDTLTPGEEGLRDLRIMMAIYESARSGRPVPLSS